MRKPSRLVLAKEQIVEFLNRDPGDCYAFGDFKKFLSQNMQRWGLTSSTSSRKFAEFLVQERILQFANISFPHVSFSRYIKPECPAFDVAASLLKGAYFSHYSAVFFHDFSEQLPRTVYINSEQPNRPHGDNELKQRNIDLAFARPWRTSNNVARYKDYSICRLNGMNTGNLGVNRVRYKTGHDILVTDVERTLIDIAVRPVYSGGIFEVLKAYKAAIAKTDLEKLVKYLKRIGFVYPYHQAIGFYLERAGAPQQHIAELKALGLEYDFYLTHEIRKKEYSRDWRLYYPSGF